MSPRARTRLRLLLRDLAATAAFVSIVLSGSVPVWALAAYGIALVISLLGYRPLAERPVISVVVLLFIAVVLFGLVPAGRLDLVVAACTFAGLVTSHRMVSRPTPGTDQQVHLTSLLTLAGGAALTGEVWFGLCLAAFTICATLSLGLGVLEPPEGSNDVIDIRPAVSRIALGSFAAIVGGIIFFIVFPRLSWNLAARRVPPGLTGGQSGMSDSVRLGGAGDIKSSPRIVARVKLGVDPHTDRLDAYWPGRSFDTFNGREWHGTGREKSPKQAVVMVKHAPRGMTQQIELLPGYASTTVIGLDTPVAYSAATGFTAGGPARVGFVERGDEEIHFAVQSNAYLYTAVSVPPENAPKVAELAEPERYLQLPEMIDPRVAELAASVIGTNRKPRAAAAALQRYLQSNYEYTLELAGDEDDPLAGFLFVRKQGHCEHFATALTVMLRTQGIAARVMAGFFGGEHIGDSYVLRAGDAHAWTQVFVPGEGWQTFDATPESGRGSRPQAFLAWVTTMYERLEAWWSARVVDYNIRDQFELARSLVRPPQTADANPTATQLPGFRSLAVAAGVALAIYLLVLRLLRPRSKRPHPASSFLEQIELRLTRAGIAQLPGENIEETAARLGEAAHPIAPALRKATRAYVGARFGGTRLERPQRDALLAQIKR